MCVCVCAGSKQTNAKLKTQNPGSVMEVGAGGGVGKSDCASSVRDVEKRHHLVSVLQENTSVCAEITRNDLRCV